MNLVVGFQLFWHANSNGTSVAYERKKECIKRPNWLMRSIERLHLKMLAHLGEQHTKTNRLLPKIWLRPYTLNTLGKMPKMQCLLPKSLAKSIHSTHSMLFRKDR